MERHSRNLVALIREQLDTDKPLTGLEVGVFKGLNAAALLSELPKLFLKMLDPFLALPPGHAFSNSRFAKLTQDDLEGIYAEAQERCRFAGGRAMFVRKHDHEFITPEHAETFDLVFLDAHHDFQSVADSMKLLWPTVKPGGLYCGHDYGSPKYHGVKTAVDAWFAEQGREVNTRPGRIWWTKK